MQKHSIKIGIVGNPNTGKSTLFNALTGARQHVGNWPGKTIEKKEGVFTHNNHTIKIIDLPGSYSLTAYTEEETITSRFILEEHPDAIIQILDAQNLERNLFMTIQLIELGAPLVIAINMLDLAEESGIEIDTKKPRYLMGVGSPIDLLESIEQGVDIFDSVMPTRNARHNELLTSAGKMAIDKKEFCHETASFFVRRVADH